MTATHAPSCESVSPFALFWLSVAAALGLVTFLLITFRLPILAFVKATIWPHLDLI